MTFFRERHNLKTDYSGYQEVSPALRNRLKRVCFAYVNTSRVPNYFAGVERRFIPYYNLEHELAMRLNNADMADIIYNGSYGEVFEAIEIFIDVVNDQITFDQRQEEIWQDVARAFDISGSVYFLNRSGQIELRIEEDLAKQLEEAKDVLSGHKTASETFFDAVGNLMARKSKPSNVVKDIFVSFENYLKEQTGEKDFGGAIDDLKNKDVITSTQKALLDKLYAYRSDSFAVGHAGNSKEPDEINAFWFLETVISQMKLIHRKLSQSQQNAEKP